MKSVVTLHYSKDQCTVLSYFTKNPQFINLNREAYWMRQTTLVFKQRAGYITCGVKHIY